MKPYELFKQWSQFEALLASPSMSDEDKLQMGWEWVRSLPPTQLCMSSTLSRIVVENAMRGRLNALKEEIYGRETKEAESKDAGQKPAPGSKRSSKKPVHKDAGNT